MVARDARAERARFVRREGRVRDVRRDSIDGDGASVFRGGVAVEVASLARERAALDLDGAARGRVAVRGGLVGAKGDVDGVKLSKGKNGAAV